MPERQRHALLTIGDFAPIGFEFENASRYESFERTTYFDGSYTIDYEFDPTAEDSTIYLAVSIDVERSVRDARLSMLATRKGMSLVYSVGGLRIRQDSTVRWHRKGEKREAVSIPDELFLGDLLQDTSVVGQLLMARFGVIVYSVLVTGYVFDFPDTWRSLLDPRLVHLDSLTARAR